MSASHLPLCVLARGGSKGLPGKNVRALCGKPLIAWTVEAGLGSDLGPVLVSTDDEAIAAAAREAGADVPFMRPTSLATDEAASADVLVHLIEAVYPRAEARPHWLMLLQPTSPLRTTADILAAHALHLEHDAPVLSVVRASKPPSWYLRCDAGGQLRPALECPPVSRRQELDELFLPNGAIYVLRIDDLLAGRSVLECGAVPYLMPASRSVDIDTQLDWLLAEALLTRGHDG